MDKIGRDIETCAYKAECLHQRGVEHHSDHHYQTYKCYRSVISGDIRSNSHNTSGDKNDEQEASQCIPQHSPHDIFTGYILLQMYFICLNFLFNFRGYGLILDNQRFALHNLDPYGTYLSFGSIPAFTGFILVKFQIAVIADNAVKTLGQSIPQCFFIAADRKLFKEFAGDIFGRSLWGKHRFDRFSGAFPSGRIEYPDRLFKLELSSIVIRYYSLFESQVKIFAQS